MISLIHYFSEGAPVSTSTLMDETDYAERIRRLESQLQAREDVILCQICMERDKNVVFSVVMAPAKNAQKDSKIVIFAGKRYRTEYNSTIDLF